MIHPKTFSGKLKANLSKVSAKKARAFLFKNGYSSSSFHMPEYYVPKGLSDFKLVKINWTERYPVKITRTLDVITPKGYLSWRNFNFLDPYIFSHLVTEMTSTENWGIIKKLLAEECLVHSYSTPVLILGDKDNCAKRAIINWLQMAEKDLIKECPKFNCLTVTDIKNFYPSIYTHSIAWAIHGKEIVKKAQNRRNYNLLGNRLDKLFQNSNDGQTNGIPIGSMASDIIAELILIDVDKKLSKKIKFLKLEDRVLVSRYRDDYRILSEKPEQGQSVLFALNKILQTEFNLYLNNDKTKVHNDIINGTFRPWMLEIKRSALLRKIYYKDFSVLKNVNDLKDCLVEVYDIQKRLGGSTSIVILGKLAEGFFAGHHIKNLGEKDIPEIVSLLRKITLLKEEVTPQTFSLLDIMLRRLPKRDIRKTLNAILGVVKGKLDQDYQLIWFYRLCLSQLPKDCGGLSSSIKAHPLIRVLDRGNYANDHAIFSSTDISALDRSELSKFSLVDRSKLGKVKNKKINPKLTNPFRY